jgi:membrane protease YdiL (CAAX protease family)
MKSSSFRPELFYPYVLITFGITWGILAAYMCTPDIAVQAFGPLHGSHPLFFAAVYAPAIAALTLVLNFSGLQGVCAFLRRLTWWRISWGWMVFLFVGVPVPFFIGAALKGTLSWSLPTSGVLISMGLMLIKGPVEEIGWRGFALPLLQRRFCPLTASLILGGFWGVWHYPAFLLSGTPQSGWNFSAFFLGTIVLSVLSTGFYNRSKGSILLPALFHFQVNNPLWPDGQPWDTVVFLLLALLTVLLNRSAFLDQNSAITSILPTDSEGVA